jgi:hypothetical protein
MVDFLGFSILFFVGIISLIPLAVAVKRYSKYKLGEYVYFIGFWLSGTTAATMIGLEQFNENLWYWKIREVAILTFFAMVYFQALRVIEFSSNSKYRKFVLFGILYLVIAIISVLFWEVINENNYKTTLNLPETESLSDIQFGIIIDNTIFYSTSFVWVRTLFGIIAFWTFFYCYFSLNIVSHNPRISTAHRLWKITAISGIVFSCFQWIPSFLPVSWSMQIPFAFIAVISSAIIATFYPEGYLIAKPQVTRILDIYNLIDGSTDNMFAKIQIDETELYDYLMAAKESLEK